MSAFLIWCLANYGAILAALIIVLGAAATLCGALASLFLLIPGPHPEDWLYKIRDMFDKVANFLSQFSKK